VPYGRGDEFTLDLVKNAKTKKFLLLNKIDLIAKRNVLPIIDHYSKLASFDEVIPISARSGDNIETLVAEIMKHLPEGPMFYPAEQISDQQERSITAEMIRVKVILLTEEELPYSTAVVIDRFEEAPNLHRVYATIFVDRESQKGIVIGRGGERLKEIGTAARKDLETFFGRKIFLELHVKLKKGWRDNDDVLRTLGLRE
jgi:GTP-binding protein Era